MKGSEGTDVRAFRNRLAVFIGVASGLGREFAQAGPRGKGVDVVYDSIFRCRVATRCERLLLRFAYGRSGSNLVVNGL
jgi:hypothetical protein